MISNYEITEFISDKVIASTDVDSFCQAEFSHSLLVMIGVDVNNPPEIADFPCLIIEPTMKNIGSQDSNFDYEIVLHLGIKGSEKPTSVGNKVTYEGIYQIETLGNIIVELLREEFGCNTNMETYDVAFYHDEINAFPTYSGVVVASLAVPHVIGDTQITFN